MSIDFGSVRQVWFAPISDAADKTALLIRDDAYSRRTTVSARHMRLGDPVDTSTKSAWKQTTWQGGEGQKYVSDAEMYAEGSADTTTLIGKMRLWPGLALVRGNDARDVGGLLVRAGKDWWGGGNTLHVFETENLVGLTSEETNWQGYEYDHDGLRRTRTFSASPPMATTDVEQENANTSLSRFLVGTRNGVIWVNNDTTDTYAIEKTMNLGRVNWRAMAPFNGSVYIGSKYRFSRRTWDTTSWVATYTKVKDVPWLSRLECFTVWNNRLWLVGRSTGWRSVLLVSDGTTLQEAFKIDGNFRVTQMVVHYGSLYILGFRPKTQSESKAVGEVWRYNGTSLTRIWSEPVDQDGNVDDTPIWAGASWKQYLVWGRSASATDVRPAQLMFYDHELDAVIAGPSVPCSPGAAVHITDITPWQNTLAIACIDNTDYTGTAGPTFTSAVWYMRGPGDNNYANGASIATGMAGQSFGYVNTVRQETVRSSVFDSEIPYEDKVWLNAKVRCAIPQGTTVNVAAIFNEDDTEVAIATLAYDAGIGEDMHVYDVPLKVANAYTKSPTIEVVLKLNNSDTDTYPNATPVVDSFVVEYTVAPQSRKDWNLRVVAHDDQVLLDGTTPRTDLATTAAITDYVQTMFESGEPVYFWDAQNDGDVPGGAGAEVVVRSVFEQSYRLDTALNETVSEVSLELGEFL